MNLTTKYQEIVLLNDFKEILRMNLIKNRLKYFENFHSEPTSIIVPKSLDINNFELRSHLDIPDNNLVTFYSSPN